MDRDRMPHLIMKYQPFEKRRQGRHFQGLATVTGIGIGQEAYNKNSCESDAVKLKVLNWGEIWKQCVDHNLLMLNLLLPYILHNTRVGRVAGVSKEFAAPIFGVVQEDQDTSFFEESTIWPSAHVEKRNKWTLTVIRYENLKPVIIYYNPNK